MNEADGIDRPRLEFPCEYPIKVIGEATTKVADIINAVRHHAPDVTPDQINTRQSRAGNYQSVRITIVATGEPQLRDLHAELMAIAGVRMVL